jgi:hypothetical protein
MGHPCWGARYPSDKLATIRAQADRIIEAPL